MHVVYVCWFVSISRHRRSDSGLYAQPGAQTLKLDWTDMGLGIVTVEAGCCDTSQHRWQSLNEDLVFTVDWLWFGFEFSVLQSTFVFFSEEKVCSQKEQLVQDLIPPLSIYICMCTLYTYTNIYMLRFSPSVFFRTSRCHGFVPTPGLASSTPCAVCVYVCVYTHIHPHTLPLTSKKRKDTDNTPIIPSVEKNPHAKRQTVHRRGFRVWAFLP